MSPILSLVASLYLEQNSDKLIPAGPNTVPTGGAGLAFPAGICNLMIISFCSSFVHVCAPPLVCIINNLYKS